LVRQNEAHCAAKIFGRGVGAEPFPWRVRRVGVKARELLSAPGFFGRVLAVLSATAYLSGSGGEILWMAREGLPAHRRCILTAFEPRSICAGQSFFVQGSGLRIGEEVAIDLDQAEEWEPPAIWPDQAEPLASVNAGFRRLLAAIPVPGGEEGLGQAILLVSAIADGEGLPTFPAGSLVARALSPLLGLARACLVQDLAQVVRRGRELVGLGSGLTPSGDDFLGGLLFAVHFLKIAYPGDFPGHQEPIVDLIDWAGTQTHPISHTILGDLALGHGPEPLHDVITALLTGEDLSRPTVGVARLVEIGHNSGWDILAGLLTGMLLVEGKIKSKNQNPSNSLAL